MAKLRPGDHWVDWRDKKQGVRTTDGSVVTRQQGENRGAQWFGFNNDNQLRKARSVNTGRLAGGVGPEGMRQSARSRTRYQNDLAKARATAHDRGQRFDKAEFDSLVAGMGSTDSSARNRARDQYNYLTGVFDRPDTGGSP